MTRQDESQRDHRSALIEGDQAQSLLFDKTLITLSSGALAVSLAIGAGLMVAVTLSTCSVMCALPVFWALPSTFLTGVAAAGGIALINSLGNLGGFVAPILRTTVNQVTASDTGTMGVYALGVLPFVAAVPAQAAARRSL